MRRICITGGAGFVGSHLVDHFADLHPQAEIVVVDKLTYAARLANLRRHQASPRFRVVQSCITDTALMKQVLRDTDLVIHAAAESHVDNSYADVSPFLDSNVRGTVSMLQAAVACGVGLFIHVSTDEVYGESVHADFSDLSALSPTNPYAASKAAADMFVHAAMKSYGLAVRVTRANNMYGIRQFPEKLIPKLICDIHQGRVFPIHGKGEARRSFLAVQDFCRAVERIISHGSDGVIYNVPSAHEYSVMDVARLIADRMGVPLDRAVAMAPDRPFNDCRYGVTGDRLEALGWQAERWLEKDIDSIIAWYRKNIARFAPVAEPARHRVPA